MTDLRSTIPALIAHRTKVGASTPIGRRLSTAIEQIENKVSPSQTLNEVWQIMEDMGEYIHVSGS